jgi:hypothetical protein
VLIDNNVSAVFHGHDHQFGYEKRDGIVYQAVPSSGFTGSGFAEYSTGNYLQYVVKALDSSGHLRVTVAPDKATVEYVRSGGTGGSYSYSITCAGDFDNDGDVDGKDLAALIANTNLLNIAIFAQNFGRSFQGSSSGSGLASFTATGSVPAPSPSPVASSVDTAAGSAPVSSPSPVASSGEENSGSGGYCFIATAAYGSYSHPDVKLLRDFRDRYLLTNAVGRIFTNCYYRLSPAIASFITQSEILRITTKVILKPVIYGIRYPYMFVLLFPAGIVVILWRKKARSLKDKKSS